MVPSSKCRQNQVIHLENYENINDPSAAPSDMSNNSNPGAVQCPIKWLDSSGIGATDGCNTSSYTSTISTQNNNASIKSSNRFEKLAGDMAHTDPGNIKVISLKTKDCHLTVPKLSK